MKLTIPGVDAAWGAIPYDSLKAAGYKFFVGYLSPDASKNLVAAEVRELWKRGIYAGLVWESGAGAALAGRARGVADAKAAKAHCEAVIPGAPIAFAVDRDIVSAGQLQAVAAYFQGIRSVLPKSRVGVYAEYDVVQYLATRGICGFYWQTYAWSRGLIHPQACARQDSNGHRVGGLGVDFNHADPSAFTLWLRGPKAGPSGPHRDERKLRLWRRHLSEVRHLARLIGWVPALRGYAAKLKALIAREGKRPA